MSRSIITGAPGAGKTTVVRQLEVDGHRVVEEAATDVIALSQAKGDQEPWRLPTFVDRIIALQRLRETAVVDSGSPIFHDRSPICTLALSRYLGWENSAALDREVERVMAENIYQRTVFFVRLQGSVTPTSARRISLAEAEVFETIHRTTYLELGFDLTELPPGPPTARAAIVQSTVGR